VPNIKSDIASCVCLSITPGSSCAQHGFRVYGLGHTHTHTHTHIHTPVAQWTHRCLRHTKAHHGKCSLYVEIVLSNTQVSLTHAPTHLTRAHIRTNSSCLKGARARANSHPCQLVNWKQVKCLTRNTHARTHARTKARTGENTPAAQWARKCLRRRCT
jgi:hypothetical protein